MLARRNNERLGMINDDYVMTASTLVVLVTACQIKGQS